MWNVGNSPSYRPFTYFCLRLRSLCLLEEARLLFGIVLLSPLPPGSLQVLDTLLLWGGHLQVPLLQIPVWPKHYFSVNQMIKQSRAKAPTSYLWEQSCWFDTAPLIGPESGICTRQNIFQLGAEFIQFYGKPGEAIVQLVVCGHGAWQGEETTQTKSSNLK